MASGCDVGATMDPFLVPKIHQKSRLGGLLGRLADVLGRLVLGRLVGVLEPLRTFRVAPERESLIFHWFSKVVGEGGGSVPAPWRRGGLPTP